ncbi:secretion protein snm4 [Streptomyces oceani]|uniref:Secretion protein snm4 n=2 Tax=Streptomyces oceani TaxID=1075402 RepID=A0A1E7KHX5_9ACTN|nr:secretion protein snm4 [Streptomyces oceani]
MLLPAGEPVGELLPDILRLLGDRPGPQPLLRRLVTPDGAVLAQDDTLGSAGIADGMVLRLVRAQETPPAPVVHDVTDETSDDLDVRDWRWGQRARTWTAGVACVVLGLVAAVAARDWLGADEVVLPLVITAVTLAVIGASVARWGEGSLGTTVVLLAGVLGVFAAWTATGDVETRLAAVALPVCGTLLLLGVCTGVGRGGVIGAGAAALFVGGWELGWALTDGARVGVALGVVSVLSLGFLPRFALMSVGLTQLDDRRSQGVSVSRHQVDLALAATHRGLASATVVTALSAAVGGWLAVSEADSWTVATGLLLSVVLFSRSRAFPLALEVVALQIAGTSLVVRLLVLWADQGSASGPLAALGALALLPLLVLAVRPPEHVRVRLRRMTNLIESISVVVLIPVAIGAFGAYGRLLDTF